jgi:hypothetical protein
MDLVVAFSACPQDILLIPTAARADELAQGYAVIREHLDDPP